MQPDPITSVIPETALPLNLTGGQFQEVAGPAEPFLDPLDPGPSGHYEIDPDGLAAQIQVFEDLLHRASTAMENLQLAARNLGPPSPDEPAAEQAKASITSLTEAIVNSSAIYEYLQRLVIALRKSNGTYVAEEASLKELFRK